MKKSYILSALLVPATAMAVTYPVVDTAQEHTYDARSVMEFPRSGKIYYGQDAQFLHNPPEYKVNGDGTVSDQVTGLMWTRDPGQKKTYNQAVAGAAACRTGGYSDWRLPTVKELYSLIQFNGTDPNPMSISDKGLTPFIDNRVFTFTYGQAEKGERIIDAQYATSTLYVADEKQPAFQRMFGVNFADGRIKGYPIGYGPRGLSTFYVHYVRGNPAYGKNQFKDNGDGTILDEATGLTWMKADSVETMDWPTALAYAETFELAGHTDWRLPNAKELQSLVDYSRSPDTSDSAVIDPVFDATAIVNEAGYKDFAHYWTGTSHCGIGRASSAVYIAFGRALGFMRNRWVDIHGAGCQRSDPKTGDPSVYAGGFGPQGDAIRIKNMVRLVRGGDVSFVKSAPEMEKAQASPPGGFMGREDRDGDGKVTRSEFKGPAVHFERFDKNKDGVISTDEAPTGPPK